MNGITLIAGPGPRLARTGLTKTDRQHHPETLMASATYEYQSDFARRHFYQGKAEGVAEGAARALLTVLAARGIDVPDSARQRITQCTDADQLEAWVRRATTVSTLDEVFGAA